MKNTPLVSICIPTYNGASYIKETLECAVNQSYKNLEIVITDDHSSDDTIAICERFAAQDNRIKIYHNPQNLGLVGNWCESVEKATGNWIKFLFQDDLISTNAVEKMIDAALKFKVNYIICNREYFFDEGYDEKLKKFYTEKLPKTEELFPELRVYLPEETAQRISPYIFHNCIGEPPCFLFHKDSFHKTDFPENYKQLVDYTYILNKILKESFVYISEKLVQFRVHNNSQSMKNKQMDVNNKPLFYNYMFIEFYERIQLCYEILNLDLYKEVRRHIPKRHLILLKDFYVFISYKRHTIEHAMPFYEQSALKDFILTPFNTSYSYLKYKWIKFKVKFIKKRYHLK